MSFDWHIHWCILCSRLPLCTYSGEISCFLDWSQGKDFPHSVIFWFLQAGPGANRCFFFEETGVVPPTDYILIINYKEFYMQKSSRNKEANRCFDGPVQNAHGCIILTSPNIVYIYISCCVGCLLMSLYWCWSAASIHPATKVTNPQALGSQPLRLCSP